MQYQAAARGLLADLEDHNADDEGDSEDEPG